MTKRQRIEHKIGNQLRKTRLIALYYKTDWQKKGWIPLGQMIQNGKYTPQS